MRYKLICTSYNELKNGRLQLRNNWIEDVPDDKELMEIIEKWSLPDDFHYPTANSISNILEGEMETGNPIHVRIVRFKDYNWAV